MKRGTSSRPVIFGTLGMISGLVGAFLTLIWGSFIAAYSDNVFGETMNDVTIVAKMVAIASIIGFIASLFGKRLYVLSGLTMAVCSLLIFLPIFTLSLFLIFPASFFAIASIKCFTQKKVKMKLSI